MTPNQPGQATAPTQTRGEAQSRNADRMGSQPTESEFEEITADTLLGSHFVRTWPRSAGSTAGSWDGPRDARAGTWDRTRKLGSPSRTGTHTVPRRPNRRGKL